MRRANSNKKSSTVRRSVYHEEFDDIDERGEILRERSVGCASLVTFLRKQESNLIRKHLHKHLPVRPAINDPDSDPLKFWVQDIPPVSLTLHQSFMRHLKGRCECQILPCHKIHQPCLTQTVSHIFPFWTDVGKVPPLKHIRSVGSGDTNDRRIPQESLDTPLFPLTIHQPKHRKLRLLINAKRRFCNFKPEFNPLRPFRLNSQEGEGFLDRLAEYGIELSLKRTCPSDKYA